MFLAFRRDVDGADPRGLHRCGCVSMFRLRHQSWMADPWVVSYQLWWWWEGETALDVLTSAGCVSHLGVSGSGYALVESKRVYVSW